MTWRRFETLVNWLPAGSWWQRYETPTQGTSARSNGAGAGGRQVQVIDAATNPEKARSYFAGMAAGGT